MIYSISVQTFFDGGSEYDWGATAFKNDGAIWFPNIEHSKATP